MTTLTNRYPDDRDLARLRQELDILRSTDLPQTACATTQRAGRLARLLRAAHLGPRRGGRFHRPLAHRGLVPPAGC
ncbi:hypothetical protein [Agilicoccus flavus]|uniref:hypothetical protein n=1 Tax=Agilicoccus flavus TaxID=2775968 RepID=UPI001CF66EA6|nr:hypothetical protein [Agilicoccus flavus]